MATEAQLRRRMNELQSEVQSLRGQSERLRRDMVRQMNDSMERMRAAYQKELVRQQRETEEAYSRRIRAFQEEMVRTTKQQYEQLERETGKIAARQNQKIAELSACNEELRELLQRVKGHAETVEKNHRTYAIQLLQQMQQHRQETEATPHEFFYRGEFAIIDSHAAQIEDEILQEMFQAAAADASSVTMEFDLLRTKVQQALDEWIAAFQDYARIVRDLVSRMQLLEGHPLQTAAGTFTMALRELDFWSCGTYLPYREKVMQAVSFVEEVDGIGVREYLRRQTGMQRKEIFSRVTQAQQWEDELAGITNCVWSERMLSDERWWLAGMVAKNLRDTGYQVMKRQFRAPAQETTEKVWYPKSGKFRQNPLDSYELVASVQGMDLVNITFVPVRLNGVAVRNECIVSLTAVSLANPELIAQVVQTNVNRVRQCTDRVAVSGITESTGQNRGAAWEETRRKKQPDPHLQIRYIERKYH